MNKGIRERVRERENILFLLWAACGIIKQSRYVSGWEHRQRVSVRHNFNSNSASMNVAKLELSTREWVFERTSILFILTFIVLYRIIYDMKKSKVTFMLDEDLREFLSSYAKERRMTLTQVLVQIILDFVNKEKPKW